ncbi:MAG: YkgJ family cysteine cluster protein, partial [Nitrosopumilaceae archaeon]|nr:YkgJ family cysteine cluster protein [Nitrosopumilaceae archaeon]
MSSGKKFECVEECSQCCIEREYYPSVEFGKIGVLVLPEEKDKIEELAKKRNIKITILPRI